MYVNGSGTFLSDYQESHILEEEEKLEEETQQTHLEFHQQLVTEIQEALQFLQQHMEQVVGQILVQHARWEAGKKSSDDGQDFQVWKYPNKMSATLLKRKAVSFMHYPMPSSTSRRPLKPVSKQRIPCKVLTNIDRCRRTVSSNDSL